MSSSNNNNNNISTHIPILDGTNYREWKAQMTTFLQAAGLWLIVNGTIPQPVLGPAVAATATTPAILAVEQGDLLKWQISNQQALGNITLCLFHNVCNEVGTTSAQTWTNLETEFGSVGVSWIYGDFKALVGFKISGFQHPAAELQRFFTHLECLHANNMQIPNDLIRMIVLFSLPLRWDHVAAMYLQGKTTMTQITSVAVWQAIVAEFNQTGRGSLQHAHKISVVKREGEHLHYSQQQQGANRTPASSQGSSRQPK